MENNTDLRRKTAFLESRLDQIETEFSYINKLLFECGFPEGLQSLKLTIEDLLKENHDSSQSPKDKPSTFDFY